MLRFLINLFLTLWLGLLTAAVVQTHREVDWSQVKGLEPLPAKETPPDILGRLEQAVWRRTVPLELSETDVNRYLSRVITGQQGGFTAQAVQFDRVALDFELDQCRACFSWRVGDTVTQSAVLAFSVERRGDNFIIEPQNGAYGRLPVLRGMMCALTPALISLCGALEDEIHTVFQMNQIRFGKDKVILDPRSEMESRP